MGPGHRRRYSQPQQAPTSVPRIAVKQERIDKKNEFIRPNVQIYLNAFGLMYINPVLAQSDLQARFADLTSDLLSIRVLRDAIALLTSCDSSR